MAIMDHPAHGGQDSTFDDTPFLLSNTHDFSFDLHQHPFAGIKSEQSEGASTDKTDSSRSSPGHLSLSQLRSLEAITASAAEDGQLLHAWAPHSAPGSAHFEGLRQGANSLGLLGGDFPQTPASSTPPPQQRTPQQQQQQQYQQQHQNASVAHHHHHHHHQHHNSGSSFPSPFTAAAMSTASISPAPWLRGNMDHLMGGGMLHRQQSISNLSDASSSSVYNDGASVGSQSQLDPTSPTRGSFTPSQSPMGMSHSLSSLAGLAIGTPQHQAMNPSALEDYVSGQNSHYPGHFSSEHHEQLLSLSGTHPSSTPGSAGAAPVPLMAPPANRRRSTGVAHTLYTGQVRQLRQDMGVLDDVTPMPPSHQMFAGQPSDSDVASLAASSHTSSSVASQQNLSQHSMMSDAHARMPTTPRSARQAPGQQQHPATMPPTYTFHTPQSHLANSSPDDSSALGSSISGSAFSAPRLTRMDSFDSFTTGSNISSPSSEARGMSGGATGRSLEATIADHEAKLAAVMGHQVAPPTPAGSEVGDRTLSPSSMGTMSGSSAAMSRVSSAPAQNRDGHATIPTTPVRSSLGLHQHPNSGHMPVTPVGHELSGMPGYPPHTQPTGRDMYAHHHRMHELTMSAPHMMVSRSTSSLPSPGPLMSPVSPMDMQRHQQAAAAAAAGHDGMSNMHNPFGSPDGADDMIRSPSSGVARTATPRSRGRNAAPPPLIVSSADKLHVCYCGKRFKRLEHLKRHNRVHTQERPHPCPAPGCNKWFGRTDNLTQHLKTHYRTLGRSSESLLHITQAAAAVKANGPEARSLSGMPGSAGPRVEGNPMAEQQQEARHDPHAAAAAAAAQAVNKTNMKRRITLSNDMLGGPIALSPPGSQRSPSMEGQAQNAQRSSVSPQSPSTSPMEA